MFLSHKIQLCPTKAQEAYFRKAAGTARFAYNWALTEWQRRYSQGEKTSAYVLNKHFNAIKAQEFPWMRELSYYVAKQAILNAGKAYKNFFKKQNKFPRFHKKGKNDSFSIDDGCGKKRPNAVIVKGRRVLVPVLGWVKMTQELRFSGIIKTGVISRTADKWFVSLTVEVDESHHHADSPKYKKPVVVVSNENTLATLSTGEVFEGAHALEKSLKKLKRLDRALSRKTRGSQNYKKHAMKRARLYAKISNQRKDYLHKTSTEIIRSCQEIIIEKKPIKKLLYDHTRSRKLSDQGVYTFQSQLTYKSALYGRNLHVINDNKNTSTQEIPRNNEIAALMTIHDLKHLYTVGRTEINVCGEKSQPLFENSSTQFKISSMKQEWNANASKDNKLYSSNNSNKRKSSNVPLK
jgi:putative transposase